MNEKRKLQFNSWYKYFDKYLESKEFETIMEFLKHNSKVLKRVVVPESQYLFDSFRFCNTDNLKAVVILDEPYNYIKKDVIVATGIPLSSKEGTDIQPLLAKWHEMMDTVTSAFTPCADITNSIDYLLKEENVLLINSALTVELNKPGSHYQVWQPFMKYFIEEVLNKYHRGLPIVLIGTNAGKLERFIDPLVHNILKVESCPETGEWEHKSFPKWINTIIEITNGKTHCVNWVKYKETRNYLASAELLGLPWKD